jgi:hypothetical protein
MSQASKPKKKNWPGPLGEPIEKMPKAVIELRARETSLGAANQEEEQRVDWERYRKLLLLAEHYEISGEPTPSFWFQLATALASEFVPGFAIIEMGTGPSRGRKATWSGTEGTLFFKEIEAIKSDGLSLIEALKRIRQLDPLRYGDVPLSTLKSRYHEVAGRHQKK